MSNAEFNEDEFRKELASVNAELKALERDAARYRWLRDVEWTAITHKDVWDVFDLCPGFANELDAAIDEAMGATP